MWWSLQYRNRQSEQRQIGKLWDGRVNYAVAVIECQSVRCGVATSPTAKYCVDRCSFDMTEIRPLEALGMGLATAGFVCNIVVIVVFLESRALRKPINFFLITLAFTDMTMLFTYTTNMGPFVREQSQNEGVCIAVATTVTMEFVFSVNFFTATAVLRYISILHPLTAKKILTWKKCAVIFLVMCLENVVLLWPMWNRSVPVSHKDVIGYCMMDQTGLYAKIIVATQEGISNIVIVYCYASIVVKRRQSRRTVRAASSHRIQPSVKGQDMKLLLQILCLYIIFTVSWLLLGVSATVNGGHSGGIQTADGSVRYRCYNKLVSKPVHLSHFQFCI